MGFDFSFRFAEKKSDLGMLADFLVEQNPGYPHYEGWVGRAIEEIYSGYKTAILGFSNGNLVADLIVQPHKKLPRVREIKNLRVHPLLRRRDFAHFMLRQAEVENQGCLAMMCDVRLNQPEAIGLLEHAGYIPICSTSLYDPNVPDIVMIKCFDRQTESGIIYSSRELFLGKQD